MCLLSIVFVSYFLLYYVDKEICNFNIIFVVRVGIIKIDEYNVVGMSGYYFIIK